MDTESSSYILLMASAIMLPTDSTFILSQGDAESLGRLFVITSCLRLDPVILLIAGPESTPCEQTAYTSVAPS